MFTLLKVIIENKYSTPFHPSGMLTSKVNIFWWFLNVVNVGEEDENLLAWTGNWVWYRDMFVYMTKRVWAELTITDRSNAENDRATTTRKMCAEPSKNTIFQHLHMDMLNFVISSHSTAIFLITYFPKHKNLWLFVLLCFYENLNCYNMFIETHILILPDFFVIKFNIPWMCCKLWFCPGDIERCIKQSFYIRVICRLENKLH